MIAIAVPLLLAGAAGIAFAGYRSAMKQAEVRWSAVEARAVAPTERFHEAMVAQLPEIARRYFRHAIEPGTRLATTAQIEMRGTFLLGDKTRHQTYR